ncbi:MAG: N-acetylmuramoyl-L-alanine amidase [Clostridia bacterium]|nr:N-acetylmuramoyl-L-alanine amidase [Clostridia bacterium]
MPAVLLECGFISNPDQARRLTDPAWQRQVARGIAAGVAAALGRPPVPAGTPILAEPRASVAQAQTWARSRGATPLFILLAPLYWRLGPERGGVDPAAAYAQAARETAFGRFGGVLDESFRNPAGLKTREGGGDADPAAHQRFATWEEGVTAHLDHLALYAGAPGYPRSDTPDPRHFPFLRGAAPTVEALGGTWAPASDYGVAIVRNYLQPLVTTAPPPWEPADPWAAGAWAKAVALGVLDGTRPRDPLTRQELAVVLDRLGLLGTSAEAASSPGGPGRVGVVE